MSDLDLNILSTNLEIRYFSSRIYNVRRDYYKFVSSYHKEVKKISKRMEQWWERENKFFEEYSKKQLEDRSMTKAMIVEIASKNFKENLPISWNKPDIIARFLEVQEEYYGLPSPGEYSKEELIQQILEFQESDLTTKKFDLIVDQAISDELSIQRLKSNELKKLTKDEIRENAIRELSVEFPKSWTKKKLLRAYLDTQKKVVQDTRLEKNFLRYDKKKLKARSMTKDDILALAEEYFDEPIPKSWTKERLIDRFLELQDDYKLQKLTNKQLRRIYAELQELLLGQKKFETWSDRVGDLRTLVLKELNEKFFDTAWYLRAETEMVLASFKLDQMSKYINFDLEWEEFISKQDSPIVLRLNKPKKPKKKRFTINDLHYDITEELTLMLQPLAHEIDQTKELFQKVTLPKKLLDLENSIAEAITQSPSTTSALIKDYQKLVNDYGNKSKRYQKLYRQLFVLRNKITLITQAFVSRMTFSEFRENVLDDLDM